MAIKCFKCCVIIPQIFFEHIKTIIFTDTFVEDTSFKIFMFNWNHCDSKIVSTFFIISHMFINLLSCTRLVAQSVRRL
nr:MAG TPA: hypothetical protein [Caudoviricetes sp.]